MKQKIRKIYKKSIEIFKNCSFKNGAIVASDITDPEYPKDVKWYGYVWPRDASYTCVACDLVGLKKLPEKFFEWCWSFAELMKEKGIFLAQKYYPNGRVAGDSDVPLRTSYIKNERFLKFTRMVIKIKTFYLQFQPDQTASLLWAIYHHSKFREIGQFKELIERAANGICNIWKKDHFVLPSYDLWEERVALPQFKQVHTYSLAMCIKGLECASILIEPRKKWMDCIKQMKSVLERCYLGNNFVRTYGKVIDKTIDSSLIGLVWPSEVFKPNDVRITRTIKNIIESNEINGGILRYKNDKYDGKIRFADLKLGSAGAWPVLNFWISIYFSLVGNREEATKYFNWVVNRVDEKLPEQIKNDKPTSIIPLAWSHAMFIISGKFLKLF